MAPAKREWQDMMFDADPVFDVVIELDSSSVHSSKRVKESLPLSTELSTYLGSSDDDVDQEPPILSADSLENDVNVEDFGLLTVPTNSKFFDDFMTTRRKDTDFSSSDDDNGYSTMFNSPAHVLDAECDIPFIDSLTDSDSLLAERDVVEAAMDAVRSLSTPSSPLPSPVKEKPEPEAPPARKAGKPPVNPTRWAHNSTERKRRLEIRKLFSGLRDLFPDIAGDDKISNITTLNRAIEHVSVLKSSISRNESEYEELKKRNAILKARARECVSLEAAVNAEQRRLKADLPAEAAAVLDGSTDPELRKQLPAALRQLLDHNGRGFVEQKPLARRRPKTSLVV